QALLSELAAVEDYVGDQAVRLPGGSEVVLEGLGTRAANAMFIDQMANSVENALADYRQTYLLLPESIKAGAPTPESLAGATLEEIRQALADIDAALEGSDTLGAARLEPVPNQPGPDLAPAQIAAGVGNDQDAACAAPTG